MKMILHDVFSWSDLAILANHIMNKFCHQNSVWLTKCQTIALLCRLGMHETFAKLANLGKPILRLHLLAEHP